MSPRRSAERSVPLRENWQNLGGLGGDHGQGGAREHLRENRGSAGPSEKKIRQEAALQS